MGGLRFICIHAIICIDNHGIKDSLVSTDNESTPNLSKRQIEVLRAVAKGLSNQEIAQELTISSNTVRVHLRNIFEKIEVQSRTEATMWAVQHGLIVTETSKPTVEEPATEEPDSISIPTGPLIPSLAIWQRLYFVFALVAAGLFLFVPVIKSALHQPERGPLPPRFNNRWQDVSQMSLARSDLTLVTVEGELYIIGGNRTSGPTGWVEIYDPETETWREGPSKPTPVAEITAVIIDGTVYIAGGCAGNQDQREALTELEIFHPKDGQWAIGKALPEPRCGYAATAYDNELYLIGGWNGEEYVDTILVYTPAEDNWRMLDTTYPLSVGYAAAATVDDKIYVAGGFDGQREYADLNILNTATFVWESGPSMHQPRGGLGLVTAGNSLYAIGGGWTATVNTIEQLSLDRLVWQQSESLYLNQWRNFGITVNETQIYVAGGWNGELIDRLVSYRTSFSLFLPVVQ